MIEKIINQNSSTKVAYKINNRTITYGELIEKSKCNSIYLKRQGNSPVIIYGHKSINTFLSIFSCIEAKRAYVPVDLCTPIERIKTIIKLTNSTLVLTDENISFENTETISLDILTKYENTPLLFNEDNNIAYYIFTSGSTGEPKGVPITYGNLLNFVKWIKTIVPLSTYKNINVLNQASFSFDLSVADVFYSINNGHTVIAMDKTCQDSYYGIFELINKEKINLMVITPTFIKLCLVNNEFNERNFNSLKCIYFCGEQLESATVKKIFSKFPKIKIINAYGPTEATSAVSAIEIDKSMQDETLLPVGELGKFSTNIFIENNQIILSGKSVFPGYISCHSNSHYQVNNENYFNTGDLGYIENNKLYCKGRIDNQIKYKGYRIELGDIENNIYKIKGIKECAVVAKYSNEFNVKAIKAFVTVNNDITSEYIKDELKKKIPHYMIPKSIIILDKMPINDNQKIDRKKLKEL